jgi:hypothetical protein
MLYDTPDGLVVSRGIIASFTKCEFIQPYPQKHKQYTQDIIKQYREPLKTLAKRKII